jgi:Zn-dependent M28 family amino/carboxypeptidase
MLGAVGCAGAQKPAATVPDSVATAQIMRRLSALSADSMEGRLAGTTGGKRARAWIMRELNAMGVKPLGAGFEHPVKLALRPNADTVGANIVARIPGKRGGGPTLVLSAHYDHLGIRNGAIYNGADDDASGCIALLTIAERLLREQPEHDVVLAFFDAEEGGLRGARAFVADAVVPLASIALNINLDMVSRQDNNAVWVAGLTHYPALRAVAEGAGKRARIAVKYGHDTRGVKPSDDWTNASDHGAFHAKSIPFLYLGVEDHPDYHGPGDDASKIDPAFYTAVIDFAYDLVKSADAQLPQILSTRGK